MDEVCCWVIVIIIIILSVATFLSEGKKGDEKRREAERNPTEIKCPYCGKMFKPPITWDGGISTQKTTSTGGNIARGAVFLPWGVVSAVKNKKFIQCPHCKMKIMQG